MNMKFRRRVLKAMRLAGIKNGNAQEYALPTATNLIIDDMLVSVIMGKAAEGEKLEITDRIRKFHIDILVPTVCDAVKKEWCFDGKPFIMPDRETCSREFFRRQIQTLYPDLFPEEYLQEIYALFLEVLHTQADQRYMWLIGGETDRQKVKNLITQLLNGAWKVGQPVKYCTRFRSCLANALLRNVLYDFVVQTVDIHDNAYKLLILGTFDFPDDERESEFARKILHYYTQE